MYSNIWSQVLDPTAIRFYFEFITHHFKHELVRVKLTCL